MEIRLNLASRPYLNRRIVQRWLILIGSTLLLTLLINLYHGLQNYQEKEQLEARIVELNKEYAQLQGLPDDYSPQKHARVMQDLSIVKQIITADQFQWSKTFSRLEDLIPDDVSIKSIQPDYKERSLQINAIAKNITAMTAFLDRLLSSDDFNQVFLLSQAETDAKNAKQTFINFGIVIQEAF